MQAGRSQSPPPNLESGIPLRTQTPVQVILGYRSKLRQFLDEPNSSFGATVYGFFSAVMIVGSSLLVIIETLPQYYRNGHFFWFITETIIIACFTVEFCLRFFAHTTSPRHIFTFMTSFFVLCDLLSIVPYYVEVLIYGEHVGELQKFTILRLFRLFRLVRCYSYSRMLQLSVDAMLMSMRKSSEALFAILLLLGMVAVVASTGLYFAERGTWDAENRRWINALGQPSHFDSIPATLWFVMEVITTVGLGDVYPITAWGKILSLPLMMVGLLIIALPSIVVGRHFAESWSHLKTVSKLRRRAAASAHLTPSLSQQLPTHEAVTAAGNDLWHEVHRQGLLLQRLVDRFETVIEAGDEDDVVEEEGAVDEALNANAEEEEERKI